MPETRNLCAQLPLDLHQRVCIAREESGLTTAQYITNLLLEYYEMKENGGKTTIAACVCIVRNLLLVQIHKLRASQDGLNFISQHSGVSIYI